MKHALLLIAHGSRNAEANEDLRVLAKDIERSGEYPIVEPAFLELAEPSIDAGAKRCVERGAETVVLLPYFLSAGVHFRRDLQASRERLSGDFAGTSFVLAEPLGRHPMLKKIVLERAGEATKSELLGE